MVLERYCFFGLVLVIYIYIFFLYGFGWDCRWFAIVGVLFFFGGVPILVVNCTTAASSSI